MIEQNTDYRLNPDLRKACQPDIKKFCKNVILKANPDKELDGEVINCLKVRFENTEIIDHFITTFANLFCRSSFVLLSYVKNVRMRWN